MSLPDKLSLMSNNNYFYELFILSSFKDRTNILKYVNCIST